MAGLKPLNIGNVNGQPQNTEEPAQSDGAPVDHVDPVEEFLQSSQGETFTDEGVKTPPPELPPLEAEDKPADAPPADKPADAASTPPQDHTKPADAAITPSTDASKPADAPATPAKITFDASAKYELAPGAEWTGEQIIAALKERADLQPKAADAEKFAQLFGQRYEDAEKSWKPVLEALVQNPAIVPLVDGILSDQEKASYLAECATYYDSQLSAQPKPPAQPAQATDPAIARELAELRQWRESEQSRRASEEQQRAIEIVNREMAQAVEQYPFIAQEKSIRDDLLLTARQLNAQSSGKGILAALELKRGLYEAMKVARAQSSAQPSPPAIEAAPLVGSGGAAPSASRSTDNRPRTFKSTDDALENWLTNPPQKFD